MRGAYPGPNTPDHMHLLKHPAHALAIAALLACTVPAARAAGPVYPASMDEAVVLTGWLHVEDLGFEGTTVGLEVNGVTQAVPVSSTGRIDLSLPAGVEAVLHFSHPGHFTKDVVVDTRFAKVGDPGKHLRHVKFAVILEKDLFREGGTYAGPIGGIAFDPDGGCLAVDHNRKLIVGRKNQPMVF